MTSSPDYRRISIDGRPQINAGLKLAWAKRHLDTFNVEVQRFLERQKNLVTFEDDLETGEYVICLDPDPLPADLGLIAGDFLCCLRASLDHLACALTLTSKGFRNDMASFPVIGIANSNQLSLFAKSVKGIPADAVTIIDSLQPYHHGDAYHVTKLWKLHRLWNIDKHRRIPMFGSGAKIPVTFPINMPPTSSSDDSGVLRMSAGVKIGHRAPRERGFAAE